MSLDQWPLVRSEGRAPHGGGELEVREGMFEIGDWREESR